MRHSLAPAATVEVAGPDRVTLTSVLARRQSVVFSRGVLDPSVTTLADLVGDRRALFVLSPSVHRLWGQRLRDYLDRCLPGGRVTTTVLHRTETSKGIDAAALLCEQAAAAGIDRDAPIVGVGGGVTTDIVGLAAALSHRGIPHIKVPTTLLGLVDAGIGTKNAVNHGGRKSAIGSFHPPECSLLDVDLISTLPRRHLSNGLAEIVKLAVVRDAELFEHLEQHAATLIASSFEAPSESASFVVRRSVVGMLEELSRDVFEVGDLRRKVDFGHTFSPHIEVITGHRVLHGEAVALDVALSSELSARLGLLSSNERDRIVDLLDTCGLGISQHALSGDRLAAALDDVIDHRGGDLNLVVPTGIGSCTFLSRDQVDMRLLEECVRTLQRRADALGESAVTFRFTA